MSLTFRVFGAAAAVLTVYGAGSAAYALPAYARNEAKKCSYCHINPQGGGPRNYRGVFFGKNNHTFAKFDDAAEAKKAGVEIGPDPTPSPKSYTPPDKPADAKTPAPAGEKPAAGPSQEPTKPANATPTMTIAQANVNYKAAEAAYLKAPKDAAKKRSFAEAIAQLGRSTMLDQSIPPARRYPEALRLYRRALALDPQNKVALADKKQIEDIYKALGRPVPQ